MTSTPDSATEQADRTGADALVPPIRREIMVGAPVETAFALFTAHIGQWWPLSKHSVFGDGALVAIEGGRIVERYGDQESVWAEVTTWEPPGKLALNWHPGRDGSRSTDVVVTFDPLDDGTLVTLVHSGWERTEDPEAAAQEYGQGWLGVLALFAACITATIDHGLSVVDGPGRTSAPDDGADESADVGGWYALFHSPGPALEDGESIFTQPMFREHLAFLERLRECGMLVAAGPVSPERGEGMAVVRVLPEHGDVDVEQLARTDDACVAAGYLQVEVRPWSVQLTG